MFDIGWTELLIVGVIALVVIGPRELPALLRTLGQGLRKVRRMASEFQGQFNDAMREAELDELRKQAEKLSSDVTSAASFDNPMEKASSELQKAMDAPYQSSKRSSKPTAATSDSATTESEPASPPESSSTETSNADDKTNTKETPAEPSESRSESDDERGAGSEGRGGT